MMCVDTQYVSWYRSQIGRSLSIETKKHVLISATVSRFHTPCHHENKNSIHSVVTLMRRCTLQLQNYLAVKCYNQWRLMVACTGE